MATRTLEHRHVKYRIDPTWWRNAHPNGDSVIAGAPMRIFRFTAAASRFLDDIEAGRDMDSSTNSLQARLVDAGAIHPIPGSGSLSTPAVGGIPTIRDVTVVIPAHVPDSKSVGQLVASLPDVGGIVVVDDGSPQPICSIERAAVLRNDRPAGPAAARNRALDVVATDFVLFLDHDVALPAEASREAFWLPLLFHMHDPATAIVAPRVRSRTGSTVLERYERRRSPLDLGPDPGAVRSGSRISYVPSAALLVRTSTLRSLGGFDEQLRYGEDVDLVWRACASGASCRYEPSVEVEHEPRATWSALLRQRFLYGTAAAALEARHPGATRPLRIGTWSAVVVGLGLLGRHALAGAVAAGTIARLGRRLESVPDRWRLAIRLAGRGHLLAARSTLQAATRTWWPITCVMCIASKRIRSIVSVYLVSRWITTACAPPTDPDSAGTDSASIDSAGTDPAGIDPALSELIRIADDLAYGCGVWYGAITTRDASCLVPRLD